MSSCFVGFDPSFTAFGISVIDEDDKQIIFNQFSSEIDKHSTLSKFNAIDDLCTQVDEFMMRFYVKSPFHMYCGEEITTVYTGYFALELYALDFHLYDYLGSVDYDNLSLYSPSTITKVTGHKSSAKEKTIFLIEDQVLSLFIEYGYSINKMVEADTKEVKVGNRWQRRKTITDGEADSFIYALHQFYKFSDNEELKSKLVDLLPRLEEAKELS